MLKNRLLAGVSLLILMSAGAMAQTAPDAAADAAGDMQEIVVYGRGETRQVQAITPMDMQIAVPGASPIKVIAKLPGVNYQAADPYGAYEWAVRISVRGFNQNQLGFTLDGVPLGDMSYANDNGLHISRAISSENLGVTQMAQGTGALDTASTSNLGGTLKFTSRAPATEAGGEAAVSYGSNATVRTYGRLDTGVVPGGGTGYISYDYQHGNKWKGQGEQWQQQANGKFVQPVGEGTLTTFVNYSDRHENDYQDLSLALIGKFGYKLDNISDNYTLAKSIATAYQTGKAIPAPYGTVDDVYYDGAGNREDILGATQLEYPINDRLSLKAMVYGHHDKGMGTWDTPYVPTPAAYGGSPISMRTTEYTVSRIGTVDSLTYTLADHTIEGGLWFENNDFDQARRYYGLGANSAGRTADEFQENPFYTQWQYAFNTKTYVFHLQDTWQVLDNLKLNYGFKSMKVENQSSTIIGDAINGSIDTSKGFLPQIGFNYVLNDSSEVFGDYAQNARAFVSSHTDGPFSTTQAGFNAIKNKLKPETSDAFELGYRAHVDTFEAVAAAYYVSFHDRLLATTVGSGIQGNPSALSNVGGVTSKGIELAGTWKFVKNWSLYGSYSYNKSTYDDNTLNGDGTLYAATKGKITVDSPQNMVKAELSFDNGELFGAISSNYMSERYYTFIDDGKVPGYMTVDLSLGYRFQGGGWQRDLEIQGNVTNLFDRHYVSSIGTNGYTVSDPTGTFQTLQAGAPTAVFVSLRKKF
ncbi:TonB-dependent receptor [Nitrospirillum iridis]|uniref:Iron complex outermembrane receptor protein n=1 Tax=Nitrospirillum iridis TaxID=765888 RepID=A0A7X0B089_9PROT|nr:TonB-dependent receptor [Nitrospirillum iridis]MBB6252295.1 iron complex outermembrane receptor protein [Nitrospirillum iridis]